MSRTTGGVGAFLQRAFQVRLASLIGLVAGSALVVEAWKYSRDFTNPERAWVSIHIAALGDPQARVRLAAVHELGRVRGPAMRQAVPALLGALRDEDTPVRVSAAHSLALTIRSSAEGLDGDVSEEIRQATPALIAAVGDKDPGVRAAAAGSLGTLCIEGRPASTGPNPGAGYEAVRPDRRVALPVLLRAARDPDGSVRANAVGAIGSLSDHGEDAPAALIEALDDADPKVRESAIIALGMGWRNREEVFLHLVGTLDPERKGREGLWAFNILPYLGPPPVEAVPGLVRALREGGDWTDERVVEYLVKIGPPARAALPKLAARARRQWAAGPWSLAVPAMIAIAPDAPETRALIPALVERLRHAADPRVRGDAAECLIRLGPHAREALPALREASAGGDPNAHLVLEKLGEG